jgi:predicted Fe-Mo cluster-binding NifX family protein
MKVAVPVTEGKISDHFGHCTHFALFDVNVATGTIGHQELVASPEHQPGLLPQWLAEKGVSVVIVKGIGLRALALFRESGIQVVVGAVGEQPEKMVLDYVRGELVTGDNLCDH